MIGYNDSGFSLIQLVYCAGIWMVNSEGYLKINDNSSRFKISSSSL